MCLGIPGRLLELFGQGELPMGKVEFGGIVKEICLAYTPEAEAGDYLIVHAGFAISLIDQAHAQEIFSYLDEVEAMSQPQAEPPPEPAARSDRAADRPGGDAP